MSGGINFDEEKRRLQYMSMRAEQGINQHQSMDYNRETRSRGKKKRADLLKTIAIIAVIFVILFLVGESGRFGW